MIYNDDCQKSSTKQSRARRKIKWNICDENLNELFKDLGIIGEIPNDDCVEANTTPCNSRYRLDNPMHGVSFAMGSSNDEPYDRPAEPLCKPYENLQADLSRIKHQRKRCYETPTRSSSTAKVSKRESLASLTLDFLNKGKLYFSEFESLISYKL